MMKSVVSMVAAIGRNRELGKNNKLLWHIPEDLKRFKQLTSGHPIIMGRKTFESIGRPLPNRLNVVVTRDPSFKFEGITVVNSLDEALRQAQEFKSHQPLTSPRPHPAPSPKRRGVKGEIFIIGGGQIFEQAMPLADRLYLTIVDATFDADVYFPDYSMFTKKISEEKGESNGYSYTFLTLTK